ncbi:fumarylacetoacetate hydrolase family protein [Shinella yambaruensis]|uniref:2-hydroxyhepta-2,4-diene-1,7-dioate isomerase n=1 Tax=Shinella yambaruensis TaxID=415996 RepID=A0ABQ5ZRL2_9HYPH|nr:fumarylacetoacetate hydrolase family protein [Shinella yambaruensis]MCJ8028555.1 fumarylacetoacetate hydrolase family protein [Shinella yambaruensis]MCU7981608.1 fumarylacetoacetate hydrolase family protein [Shinella yambaruensis]GLR53362.1 2-hydroxyhepta-2,4-diene-1,7-dioate isomerase [Shinella yambaruensis]
MDHPRFASFSIGPRKGYGLIAADGVIDLSARFAGRFPTLKEVVEADAFGELLSAAAGQKPDHALDEITYEIPIPAPEKIVCVGVNFPDRNAEYKDGQAAPDNPSLFIRFPRSFTGHDRPLIRPPESPQLDYEGEIVIVIGKGGRRIAEADALSHIAALSLCNEGTIRDWVRHAKFNVTQGKNFNRSGSIGPWLVPYADESQLADIRLETRVNGDVRQSDRTGRMIFSFRKIIAYISTFTTLVPGDVIVTGTPTGAGARFDPPIWLKPGDVVEVEAEGIGTLRNTIADEV